MPAPVVTVPPVTLPPVTVPALAPRTVPSAAQVNAAIAGISSMVQLPLFFQINAGHVAQVGNQVCTAFDQGQSFAQVKATGLSMVSAYVAGLTAPPPTTPCAPPSRCTARPTHPSSSETLRPGADPR